MTAAFLMRNNQNNLTQLLRLPHHYGNIYQHVAFSRRSGQTEGLFLHVLTWQAAHPLCVGWMAPIPWKASTAGRSHACSFYMHLLAHINPVQETKANVTVMASSNENTSINSHLSKQLAVSINYSKRQLTVAAAK